MPTSACFGLATATRSCVVLVAPQRRCVQARHRCQLIARASDESKRSVSTESKNSVEPLGNACTACVNSRCFSSAPGPPTQAQFLCHRHKQGANAAFESFCTHTACRGVAASTKQEILPRNAWQHTHRCSVQLFLLSPCIHLFFFFMHRSSSSCTCCPFPHAPVLPHRMSLAQDVCSIGE